MQPFINSSTIRTTHIAEITSQLLPRTFYQIPHTSNVKKSRVQSLPNLGREQENTIVYSNPKCSLQPITKSLLLKNIPLKTEKYNYKYTTMIQVNSEKILAYFQNLQYTEFLKLIRIYLKSLFNGSSKEKVIELYKQEIITDSVYIFTIKCWDIIEENERLYKYTRDSNEDNMFSTTEGFYHIKLYQTSYLKDQALLLLSKFQVLLGVIDKDGYKKEMDDLKDVYKLSE